MISLIAGIGIGSILAAIIGWRVALSNHRQAWINALREDLATYLKELEVMHYAVSNLFACKDASEFSAFEKQKQDARIAVLFIHRRIILRLNRVEPLHIELTEKLQELMVVEDRVPDQSLVAAMVDIARQVLKQEWEVIKWGPLAGPIRRWRNHRSGI